MHVNIDWFNGFYNQNFFSQKKVDKYFTLNKKLYNLNCHPLVNSKWCEIYYDENNPLLLEFSLNDNEWNMLHPLFDPNWYYKKYNLANSEIKNPFEHFIKLGNLKNYDSHPLVDSKLIKSQFVGISYIDLIVIIGDLIMNEKNLHMINNTMELPILNKSIDNIYMYQALGWHWL